MQADAKDVLSKMFLSGAWISRSAFVKFGFRGEVENHPDKDFVRLVRR